MEKLQKVPFESNRKGKEINGDVKYDSILFLTTFVF